MTQMKELRYRKVTDLLSVTNRLWGQDLDAGTEKPVFFATTFNYLPTTTSSFSLISLRMRSATRWIFHAHSTEGQAGRGNHLTELLFRNMKSLNCTPPKSYPTSA